MNAIFLVLILLQTPLPNQDSTLSKLNFDPYKELGIPLDSVNLRNLDYGACLETRTVYPRKFFGLFANGGAARTVRIQECFVANTELKEKLVIVTYYDRDKDIKTPIAFVFGVRNDSLEKYKEMWGKADLGFITEGTASRLWLTLSPKPERSVRDQLTHLLLAGYDTAKKTK